MATDNKAQGSSMLDSLSKVRSLYTDRYLTAGSSQSIYIGQKQKLINTLSSIQKQIDTKNDAISTYDRELQDRYAVGTPFTFWRIRGVTTLQDWILFAFFFVYGLITVAFIVLSLGTAYPLYNIAVVLLLSIGAAVLIMATIVRFA
jgi:hypothetical protein